MEVWGRDGSVEVYRICLVKRNPLVAVVRTPDGAERELAWPGEPQLIENFGSKYLPVGSAGVVYYVAMCVIALHAFK